MTGQRNGCLTKSESERERGERREERREEKRRREGD